MHVAPPCTKLGGLITDSFALPMKFFSQYREREMGICFIGVFEVKRRIRLNGLRFRAQPLIEQQEENPI